MKHKFGHKHESDHLTKILNLPKSPFYKDKKTLIFDLDETLVHSQKEETFEKPDFYLHIDKQDGTLEEVTISNYYKCFVDRGKYQTICKGNV